MGVESLLVDGAAAGIHPIHPVLEYFAPGDEPGYGHPHGEPLEVPVPTGRGGVGARGGAVVARGGCSGPRLCLRCRVWSERSST